MVHRTRSFWNVMPTFFGTAICRGAWQFTDLDVFPRGDWLLKVSWIYFVTECWRIDDDDDCRESV
jgi:hypothetical protein